MITQSSDDYQGGLPRPQKVETPAANDLVHLFQEAAQIGNERADLLWIEENERELTPQEAERLRQLDDQGRELLARTRAGGHSL